MWYAKRFSQAPLEQVERGAGLEQPFAGADPVVEVFLDAVVQQRGEPEDKPREDFEALGFGDVERFAESGDGAEFHARGVRLEVERDELDFQVWVGGLRTTDFTIEQKTLTNDSGDTSEYMVCTLGHIQTGVLNIMFDN